MSSGIPIVETCPLGSKCEEVKNGAIHRCKWYVAIKGMNPNTGEMMDEWNCSIAWSPFLMIENSQQQRSTGAAVESFRNEMIKSNETSQQILLSSVENYKQLAAPPDPKVVNTEE